MAGRQRGRKGPAPFFFQLASPLAGTAALVSKLFDVGRGGIAHGLATRIEAAPRDQHGGLVERGDALAVRLLVDNQESVEPSAVPIAEERRAGGRGGRWGCGVGCVCVCGC